MTSNFFYFCDVYFVGGNWKEGKIVPYLEQTIEKQKKNATQNSAGHTRTHQLGMMVTMHKCVFRVCVCVPADVITVEN